MTKTELRKKIKLILKENLSSKKNVFYSNDALLLENSGVSENNKLSENTKNIENAENTTQNDSQIDYRKFYSEKICRKILLSDEYKNARTILGFMPLPSEVDVIPVLKQALKDGKKVAVPKIVPETSQMDFFYVTDLSLTDFDGGDSAHFEVFDCRDGAGKDSLLKNNCLEKKERNQLKIGAFGIIEPDEHLPKFLFSRKINPEISFTKQNLVVLVPGLAFSTDGKRLGRGKGFYDIFMNRFESEQAWTKIGVCFPCQLLESVPTDENDIKVDFVLCD